MRYSGLWDIIPKDNKNFWWSWPLGLENMQPLALPLIQAISSLTPSS